MLPERISPLAMLHSNTARLSDAQAARTMRTARTSSTVSIAIMGVEESIKILSRCNASSVSGPALCISIVIPNKRFSANSAGFLCELCG